MERRTYIYWALPLFVFLSCGQLLCDTLGTPGALIVAGLAILVAWGVVWMRLYGMLSAVRPEFAVLSVLPHGIYFVSRYFGTQVFSQSPAWQNLYALTWLGFAGVGIASVRSGAKDNAAMRQSKKDPAFFLLTLMILFYSIVTFTQYYTTLISL